MVAQVIVFSYGTLFVGVGLLAWELSAWYPGYKALQKKPVPHLGNLLPFLSQWCTGALTAMLSGGLIGWATHWFIWGAGWLGDAAYVWGLGGARADAPQSGVSQALTGGGIFVVGILLIVTLARLGKGYSGSKKRGLTSGILMSLSAGVAAVVAVPLASAANLAGFWLTAVPT